MTLDIAQHLGRIADSLRLTASPVGPVGPGELVQARILSTVRDLAVAETVLGDLSLEGTGGLLDQLTGTIPVAAPAPVRLEVDWQVVVGGQVLSPGTGLLASDGLAGPEVAFRLIPTFPQLLTELRDDLPPSSVPAEVRAHVRLTAGTVVVERDLELPFEAVPLGIPTLLALFRHKNFESGNDTEDGFVLLVVPENSPLKTGAVHLNRLFEQLDETLRPLRTVAGIADFLLGIGILAAAFSAHKHFRMRAVDRIGDLDDIHMIREELLGTDTLNRDTRANDHASSLVFLGPPDRAVECFNDEDFEQGEGALRIRAGLGMAAVIRDLHVGDPVSVLGTDLVEVLRRNDDSNRFGDSMTSLRFTTVELPLPPVE